MASYENLWYIVEIDPDSDEEIGLRKEDGAIKYYTTEDSVLEAIEYYYGTKNYKLARVQTVAHSVSD